MTKKPEQTRLDMIEAAKAILPYLHASDDLDERISFAIYTRPLSGVERLRKEADELERKDAAIHAFRRAFSSFSALG